MENGIWNLYEIGLIDKAGNYTFLSKEEVDEIISFLKTLSFNPKDI